MNFYTDVSSSFITSKLISLDPGLQVHFQRSSEFKDTCDRQGAIDLLPADILYAIFCELPVNSLVSISSVCRTWNIIQNNRLTNLFFYTFIQTQKIFSDIEQDLKMFFDTIPQILSEWILFVKEPEDCLFTKTLFEVFVQISKRANDDKVQQIIAILSHPSKKESTKLSTLLGLLYLHKSLQRKNFDEFTEAEKQIKKNDFDLGFSCLNEAEEKDVSGFVSYYLALLSLNGKSLGYAQDEGLYLKYLKISGEKNFPKSLCLLGDHYSGDEDKEIALAYYQRSADLNCASAFDRLATHFKKNPATQEDYRINLMKAVEMGYDRSIFELGKCYFYGKMGFEKNIQIGISYFQQVAKNGHMLALNKMCILYATGIGVERNKKLAEDYYAKILVGSINADNETFNPQFAFILGRLYEQGFGVERNLSEALYLYSVAANAKDASALFVLGTFFEEGDFIPIDLEKMMEYYRASLFKGNPRAQFKMCQIYAKGRGDIQADPERASDYFQILSNEEHPYDNNDIEKGVRLGNIGCCYRDGLGVEQDQISASRYFHMAADLGHASAQFKLCIHYAKLGDLEKSSHYFNLLSDLYHPEGQFRVKERYRNLSQCYLEGFGVSKDSAKSAYYKKLEDETGARFLSRSWI